MGAAATEEAAMGEAATAAANKEGAAPLEQQAKEEQLRQRKPYEHPQEQ
jgi:hypothetical protein